MNQEQPEALAPELAWEWLRSLIIKRLEEPDNERRARLRPAVEDALDGFVKACEGTPS